MTQAYLQSRDDFTREIYIKRRKEDLKYFKVREDDLLHLVKPLYGICDAGDYWGATFRSHITKNLKMTPLDGDPSLYVKEMDGDTEGLLGNYVDDNIFAGTKVIWDLARQTQDTFDSKELEWDDFQFVGVKIETTIDEPGSVSFALSQPEYIEMLREVPYYIPFTFFASVRASVSWLAHSRPDICCSINRAAQVSESSFSKRKIKELNNAIQYAKKTPDLMLK